MNRERQPTGISLQNYPINLESKLLEPADQEEQPDRIINFQDGILSSYVSPDQKPIENVIRNQKYSVITFVPLVLYQQFKYFFNLFYLCTALSQFIPALKIGLLFSFVAPLCLVLFLTMVKEAYEDYQRYKKDKEINSAEFKVVCKGESQKRTAAELCVGDIIEIQSGDNIPADCLFLYSLTDKPSLFIKTDQLDGETDWKLRKALFEIQKINDFTIEYTNPKENIYEFTGSLQYEQHDKIGLTLENTLWRTVKVASGKALLMVIYTGKQTKLSMNSKNPDSKFGQMDEQLNYYSKILFAIMIILSLILVMLRGSYGGVGQTFILFFKYFLLLSSIIPISMRVNLDFAKLVYKYLIDHDKEMVNCQCRNSNIPQELGRIEFVLSDKTGTLTQNDMIFKRLFIGQQLKFEADQFHNIHKQLADQPELIPCITHEKSQLIQSQKIYDTLSALMLCHNVTPVQSEKEGLTLQGSSPDEITLVKFGQSLDYKLNDRTEKDIQLRNPRGEVQQYEILDLFPFTSESKSMGIIVRQKWSQKIVYYLKGADTVIEPKISLFDGQFMSQSCLDLAREGLRTLVITQKILSEQYYSNWKKQYQKASSLLKNRTQKIQQLRDKLQKNMNFLAVTGVQDKLQNNVTETIYSLRSIGIRVWMLTGDKIETAICVGKSVKLIKNKDQQLFIMQGLKSRKQFLEKLQMFYQIIDLSPEELRDRDIARCVLVIDGASLKIALQQIEEQFFNIAIKLPAIICSRVSPTQKAQIALLVKKYNNTKGRVLGIGDGGNDVALIQSAHVGVGIYGKEGIQAALASDFSISQFSDLNPLIYWHGRLAYKRSSLLGQFIIHRGVIITIMQSIFIIMFYFVPLPIYNGFLLLGYSTIFTMLPVFSLIMDEDISRDLALEYPILYKSTQEGNQISASTFTYWIFISIFQGSIIMILITVFTESISFYMVNTISFTCLILIEFLNVFTELHKIHYFQVISTLASVGIYIGALFVMTKILNGVQLFTSACLPATIVIVAIAWLPPFAYEKARRVLYPSEEEKMMNQWNKFQHIDKEIEKNREKENVAKQMII